MPIIKPRKKESKKEFIKRCMSDPIMNKEYEVSQRYAICNSQYKRKNKTNENLFVLTFEEYIFNDIE